MWRASVASAALLFLHLACGAADLSSEVRDGFARLEKSHWSPALGIWLDEPGDDLRAHYDGRRNPPWWPSANAVEVMIDYMNATGTNAYDGVVSELYRLQKDRRERRTRIIAELKRRNQWSERDETRWQRWQADYSSKPQDPGAYYSDFQNEYLDDSGWWSITWLKMYDRTGTPAYLQTARNIHAHMAKGWMPDKGGGIVWCLDEDKQHPNTITNGLFLLLSARLYERTQEAGYLEWARKTHAWMRDQVLYDGTALVDQPGHKDDYWTYNQGTYLGALTSLWLATHEDAYRKEAVQFVTGLLDHSGLVREDGVLIEKLGTDGDACLFKGVFARYLAQFRSVLQARGTEAELAQRLDRVLQSSADSLRKYSIAPDGMFKAEWHEGAKDQRANFNSQVSALALLVATIPSPPEKPRLALAPLEQDRFKQAEEVTAWIQTNLWDADAGLYFKSESDKTPEFMWGNGVMFSALVAAARHQPEVYRPVMLKFFEGMNGYWDSKSRIPGYEPSPTSGGGKDKYYDDNAWMVITFLEAYEFTKDERLFQRARETLEFVLSGWDDELGGGIWWHELHKGGSKNTCANAPTAVACLRLAKVSPPDAARKLVAKAREIVDWTKKTLQAEDGLYWDAINVATGEINRAKLTYNSGLMLRASLGLYQQSGNSTDLDEAKRIGAAAESLMSSRWNAYRNPAKFSHLLVEADLELYRQTGQKKLLERAQKNADTHYRMWKSRRSGDLINNASIARELWLVAEAEK